MNELFYHKKHKEGFNVPPHWNADFFRNLSEYDTTKREGAVYFYDRHDKALRNITFAKFINKEHWEDLRTNSKSKILIDYCDDYFNYFDVTEIVTILKKNNISPKQVYWLTCDNLFKKFIRKIAKDYRMNITEMPMLMFYAVKNFPQQYNPHSEYNYKFSSLSRNYRSWRLNIYLELLERKVLKQTIYSFFNIEPYEGKKFTIKDMAQDAYNLTDKSYNWISKVPHKLPLTYNKVSTHHHNDQTSVFTKNSNMTYNVIKDSAWHLCIESHYHAWQFDHTAQKTKDLLNNNHNNYAPTFLTEKFYKAILLEMPFVIASTPHTIKQIEKLGFKTFEEFVDQSYDNIIDDKKRVIAIAESLEGLNKKPQEIFDKELYKARLIAIENKKRLKEKIKKPKLTGNFFWLRAHLNLTELQAGLDKFISGKIKL